MTLSITGARISRKQRRRVTRSRLLTNAGKSAKPNTACEQSEMGILLLACARLGLLTATISCVVADSLSGAVPYIGAQATSLRLTGLVAVGLCLVALALALNGLRVPRDAAPRPSPSTAA
jgi:hypothetical protein